MATTLTRADLANTVYRTLGISHAESAEIVDYIVDCVIDALGRGEDVKLSSFGTFSVRQKNARVGRNPKTKQEIPISARKVISFHASNILVKSVNSPSSAQ